MPLPLRSSDLLNPKDRYATAVATIRWAARAFMRSVKESYGYNKLKDGINTLRECIKTALAERKAAIVEVFERRMFEMSPRCEENTKPATVEVKLPGAGDVSRQLADLLENKLEMRNLKNIVLARNLSNCKSLEQIESFINDQLPESVQQDLKDAYTELTGSPVPAKTLEDSSRSEISTSTGAYGYSSGTLRVEESPYRPA